MLEICGTSTSADSLGNKQWLVLSRRKEDVTGILQISAWVGIVWVLTSWKSQMQPDLPCGTEGDNYYSCVEFLCQRVGCCWSHYLYGTK